MKPGDTALALWPHSASASAGQTDLLIWAFTLLTLLLVVPIFIGITLFALRYREGQVANRVHATNRDRVLELGWMLIPFVLTLIFFLWGASMFVDHKNPPANATRIEAIGRQWMWKFEHPGGQSEINDLHVPTNEPIVINMISQDVIHSLYIPALRIQMETLPGRYTQLSFNADRPGTYRLFCSEFCGTDHSTMVGLLTVMTQADYATWLAHGVSGEGLVAAGKRLFGAYGCDGCHGGGNLAGGAVNAPSLVGVYGRPVTLAEGGTTVADDSYLRDSILNPDAHKLAGYDQVMPPYKGVLSEDDLLRLVAYIKSLGRQVESSR